METQPFEITWNWQEQATVDRHTSLLASFDGEGALVAEHARGLDRGEIYRGDVQAEGKWGGGVELVRDASIGHFRAGPNVNSHQGTIEMWVRSGPEANIWADGEEHWLVTAQGHTERGKPTVGLFKRAGDDALVLFQAPNWNYTAERSIVLDPGELAADRWHHIMISWEREEGRLWLAVNGEGVTGAVGESFSTDSFFVIWLGSSGNDKQAFMPLGGSIDHLRVSDCTAEDRNLLPERTHEAVDAEALATAEETLRGWFGFMERVQDSGGWANCYSYPTLLPSPTGSRQFIKPVGYVGNDKGHVGPAACWLIYAAEVLQEPWYLQLAERMGDAYLDAQIAEGAWAMDYWARPGGLVPVSDRPKVKLQDQNQVHPMYLLLYLYRLTGHDRYLDGAMKAGEFLLEAQNPNGSWSHSFDLEQGIGVTARGEPQGGEINDQACNDGMTAMLMMYHFTEDEKYLDAYVRCANWFLDAQLGPPTYGWAMQYDADNNPIWARGQEPPSMSIAAGYIATEALTQAYWVIGDEKYLQAPKQFFEWMIEASEDRRYSSWYDVETARPIVSTPRESGRIFHVDDPDELAEFMAVAVRTQYADMRERDPEGMLERIDSALRAEEPPTWAPEPDLEAAAEKMGDYVESIHSHAESQNEMGAWTGRGQGELRAAGRVVWIKQGRIAAMLRWVEDARMLTGELPATFRGRGVLEACAYPRDDWYETPLGATAD